MKRTNIRLIHFFPVIITILLALSLLEVFCLFFVNPFLERKIQSINLSELYNDANHIPGFSNSNDNLPIVSMKIPHPYFGYTTNQSFEKIALLHTKKNKDDVIIGIFGGSIAQSIAINPKQTNKIINAFEKIPRYKNKNIHIINFSQGGYKQPQAFYISTIFGKQLDITINIDGINEIYYELEPRFPFYFPTRSVSNLYYSDIEALALLADGIKYKKNLDKQKNILSQKNTFSLVKTVALFKIYQTSKELLNWQYAVYSYGKKDFYQKIPAPDFNEKVDFWLRMACNQNRFLQENKVISFFFFPPAAFLDNKKVLTPNEAKLVSEFALLENIKKHNSAYKYFLTKNKNFAKFYTDLSGIFLHNREDVYLDGCCHLNENGETILVDEIIKKIDLYFNEQNIPLQEHLDCTI